MLRAEFGRDNAYRISGDEFVAFVIDADTETLLRKVRTVEKARPLLRLRTDQNSGRNMYASKQRYYSGKTDRRKARI